MGRSIKVAIAGVGNCANALVQGVEYYQDSCEEGATAGLITSRVGPYAVSAIEFVAAFDIDRRKVGIPLGEAIFSAPNCVPLKIKSGLRAGVTVKMAPVLDGVAAHMERYPEDRAFRVASDHPVDVAQELRDSGAEILVCYTPVGSERAVRYYAQACLDSGVALVNCIPVFIASKKSWADKFSRQGIPLVGDDIKSQLGATVLHRSLVRLFESRGVSVDRTYQLNVGGNTDFLNMMDMERTASKRASKTEAVTSQMTSRTDDGCVHIGPSDYVRWLDDNKVCFLRVEGSGFGGEKVEFEARLSVQDSPNSAGVVVDVIRFVKIALDRGIGGPLEQVCAYYMKRPPVQLDERLARAQCREFHNQTSK